MSLIPVTLSNATDTWVAEGRPTINFADGGALRLSAASGARNYAYVYFPRPFPLGATITSAVLHLRQQSTLTGSRTVTARRVLQSWKVARLDWTPQPTVDTAVAASVAKTASTAGTSWDFDVTAAMQLVSDGAIWWGFRFETTDTNQHLFYSSQASTLKPTFSVTWTDAPEAPSTLTPSGGGAVGLTKPVLRFDFTDYVGNTQLQAIRVQTNATNVWTAPSFDSGTVLTTDPQLDLSTTTFPAMTAGQVVYWRVQVQDGAGVWSPWSLAASFSYQAKGTLTITNPSSGTPIVTEPTPPIIWTFTGRTQSAFQVYLQDASGNTLHTSGKTTSTATSYTLPAKLIHDGLSYIVIVRVWDTVDRRHAGDAIYVQASRTFTYTLSATVATVTGFAVTDLTPVPAAQLDWTRSTAPDYFSVHRADNGGTYKTIATNLAPADLLVSGSSYRWVDRGADPQIPHLWSVRAVVNGVTSTANPSQTATLKPVGIWIQDPATGTAVQLMGSDNGSWVSGEDAEVYTPVGGSTVVRVTQGLRGFEGTITGDLLSFGSTDVQTSVANMYALKAIPGKTLWLTVQDMTIPVIIGNVSIAPVRGGEVRKQVSFDYWQVDDLPFRATL